MIRPLKKQAFRTLGMNRYLRLMQEGFRLAYHTGLLRFSGNYTWHYFDRKLIKQGDTVLDIGANLGYYSRLFSKWVGPKGKIYAVEPIAVYNDAFRRFTRSRTNIELLPYALGTEEKEVELVTTLGPEGYRTGVPHIYDSRRDGAIETQDFRFKATMKIPHKLFADLSALDFVKCDVEGFEGIVLTDLRPLLEKFRPKVQVEVWPDNLALLTELFTELGYTAYKIDKTRLTDEPHRVAEIPGDYLFIHASDRAADPWKVRR